MLVRLLRCVQSTFKAVVSVRLLQARGGFLGLTIPVEGADKCGQDRPYQLPHTHMEDQCT